MAAATTTVAEGETPPKKKQLRYLCAGPKVVENKSLEVTHGAKQLREA